MSQTLPVLNPTVDTGAGWPAIWSDIRDALLTMHAGSGRPSYAVQGTQWLDTDTGEVKFYDGAQDIVLFTVDVTGHKFYFAPNVGIGISAALDVLHSYKAGASDKVLHRQGNSTRVWSSGSRGDLTGSPFGVRDETAGADRLLIDSSGNLIIGGAAVNTNSSHTLYGKNVGWCLALKPQAGGNGWGLLVDQPNLVTTGYMAFFAYNGTGIGSIQYNAGTSSVSYVTTSDRRLKDGIQPVSNALGTIMQLNPVSAYFKSDPDKVRRVMFIADEVAQVMPETVSGEGPDATMAVGELKDAAGKVVADNYYALMGIPPDHSFEEKRREPNYQGVDYSKFTPMLVAAVQELNRKVEALQAQLAGLQPVSP